MQRIDLKNLFQNVMILQIELWLCSFILFIGLYMILGVGRNCQLTVSPPQGICQLHLKNANAWGLAGGAWAQVELTDALGSKDILQKILPIKFEGFGCAKKGEIIFSPFHTMILNFPVSGSSVLQTNIWKIKIFIPGFVCETSFLKFDQ